MKKYRIVKIEDSFNIIINGGADNGILPNQQFVIYTLDGEEIFDPVTKKSLGNLEIVKGTGIVTFLEEKWCRITSDKYRRFTLHDSLIWGVSPALVTVDLESGMPVETKPQIGDRVQVPFADLCMDDIVKPT